MMIFESRTRYLPMSDDEEWGTGTSQESMDSLGEEADEAGSPQTQQQQQTSANDVDSSQISVPVRNDEEKEVVVEDDSSKVMPPASLLQKEFNIFDYLNILPASKQPKKCPSSYSAKRRRRRRLLIVSLLLVAALLLVILVAVPVVTKMRVESASEDMETASSKPSPTAAAGDGDESVPYENQEDADTSKDNNSIEATPTYENADNMNSQADSQDNEGTIANDEDLEQNESVVSSEDDSNSGKPIMTTPANIDTQFQDQVELISNPSNADIESDTNIQTTLSPLIDNIKPSVSTPNPVQIVNDIDENTGEELMNNELITTIGTQANTDLDELIVTSPSSNDIDVANKFEVAVAEESISDESKIEVTTGVDNNLVDEAISSSANDADSDRESQWLTAHNIRRRQWHEDNEVSYIPLQWSTGLTSSALAWAKILIDQDYETIHLYHDDNTNQGENLAMNCGTGSWSKIYPPDNILTRWVEEEVGLEPPDNLHLTQVLWRPTKWVGCADAAREYENGEICHVQVCRYSKAGNCNLGRYMDWSIPMLLDDSPCGSDCPPEGCS